MVRAVRGEHTVFENILQKNGGADFELISVANAPNTARWKK